jgi:hypothetical protein
VVIVERRTPCLYPSHGLENASRIWRLGKKENIGMGGGGHEINRFTRQQLQKILFLGGGGVKQDTTDID